MLRDDGPSWRQRGWPGAPHGRPQAIAEELSAMIVAVRKGNETWGPRKVRAHLIEPLAYLGEQPSRNRDLDMLDRVQAHFANDVGVDLNRPLLQRGRRQAVDLLASECRLWVMSDQIATPSVGLELKGDLNWWSQHFNLFWKDGVLR